ncbi:MAG: fatty acyl-AMP ligase [Steroidobacteraceae bacterium]
MSDPTPTAHAGLAMRHADFGTIAEALDYAARGPTGLNFYSGKGALVERLSYRTLREQALALARRMLGAGLEPGCRVGLIADSDGDFARAFFACQYAALVPVPLPLPVAFGGKDGYVAHLRRMVESAEADALLGPDSIETWLREAVTGLDLEIVATLAAFESIAPLTGELPPQDARSLAYLQFSSGSTRFPSGIVITQRAFMENAHQAGLHGLGLADGDRCVSWLPFYHDMGLVGFLLMPMAFQCTIDILPTHEFARRPLVWLELIGRNRGTVSYSPSFGYELCTRRAERLSLDGLDLSSWRSAGIGGDLIRPNVLARFAERFATRGFESRAFLPSYGMAEATLALTIAPLRQGARLDTVDAALFESEHRAVPVADGTVRSRAFVLCGRILPGHEIEVRNDGGRLLPSRFIGRIFVRGASLMTGYVGAPEETARVLSSDGWLDTGDLGYLLDGEIVVTGRAKDLILANGRNLWPQDLEWTVETEIGVLRSGDVAVFSVLGDPGEVVVALVQCRTGDAVERSALQTEVANLIRGRHGVEAKVVLVPPRSLPQTTSGKLSRSRARALYLAGGFAQALESARARADGE